MMVLIKLKKRDLVCFASKALSEEIYFRVIYLENEWYGMRVEEKHLSLLFRQWPNRAKSFFSNTTEAEFITPLGSVLFSIHSETKGLAHEFVTDLKRQYDKQNKRFKWKAQNGKAKKISRFFRSSYELQKI